MNIQKESFGKTENGQEVYLFTLQNDRNMVMKVITYGGIITSLLAPDKNGKLDDVVLGFNTLKEYEAKHPYFGAIIGRFGNRIAKGKFTLNGKEYKFAVNDGENHLHGGLVGFDKVVWEATEIRNDKEVGVKLTYLSKDNEEGYPGNLNVTVKYLINNENDLIMQYEATTDKTTVLNLTQHSYFNLSGEGSGLILENEMMINADNYTAVAAGSIPTGAIETVKGSPLDFTTPMKLGARIKELEIGYDHNYVLNKNNNELSLAAKVFDPQSGRKMEVWTTEPGMQLYTSNYLDGSLKGKSGKFYPKHGAFCLETQHYPDSPNHPNFPATVLNPGETYRQETIYKFRID